MFFFSPSIALLTMKLYFDVFFVLFRHFMDDKAALKETKKYTLIQQQPLYLQYEKRVCGTQHAHLVDCLLLMIMKYNKIPLRIVCRFSNFLTAIV